MAARTQAQITVADRTGVLYPEAPVSFRTYRDMGKHPTVAIARRYASAPIFLEPWSYEGDEDLVAFVESQVSRYRDKILRAAMSGYHLYGWAGFELVWGYGKYEGVTGLRRLLKNVKPLLQDITYQRIDEDSGKFLGLLNRSAQDGTEKYLTPDQSLFVNFDESGVGEYGTGSAEIARVAYNDWVECNDVARRYDEKVAGSIRTLQYPEGKTLFAVNGGNAELTDNQKIAEAMLRSLRASGDAIFPVKVGDPLTGEGSEISQQWKLELITAGGGAQPSFIARMKYLDALIYRSHGLTERSVSEGNFGTKAEAETHANATLVCLSLLHLRIVQAVQEQLIDPMLAQNFDAAGEVRLVAGDMSEENRKHMLALFTALLPTMQHSEAIDSISLSSIIQQAGIPVEELEASGLAAEEIENATNV